MVEDSGNQVKNKKEKKKDVDRYDGILNSTQTFRAIGMFEVRCGDVVLCGRHGERDHIFPLEKAVGRYRQLSDMVAAMCRNGIRGWDTLGEIADDLKRKICEAVDYRLAHNVEVPASAGSFRSATMESAPIVVPTGKSGKL